MATENEMECQHNNVNVWVLEEQHYLVDLEADDWVLSQHGNITKVIKALCEDCSEDLSEEIAGRLDLL